MMARGMLMSAFVLVGVLNVIAEATSNADAITLTKPLLMPLLLAWLVTLAGRSWPVPLRWLAAGIVFAWIGDLALMGEGDAAFMLGIAAFLVMQVLLPRGLPAGPRPGTGPRMEGRAPPLRADLGRHQRGGQRRGGGHADPRPRLQRRRAGHGRRRARPGPAAAAAAGVAHCRGRAAVRGVRRPHRHDGVRPAHRVGGLVSGDHGDVHRRPGADRHRLRAWRAAGRRPSTTLAVATR